METRRTADNVRFSFTAWLRTGRLVLVDALGEREVKFNPNHDPDTGRFTSGDGGGTGDDRRGDDQSRHGLAKPQPVRLKDGSTVPNPRSSTGVLMQPPGVSLTQNVAQGASWLGVTANAHMLNNFRPGGAMDYQRTFSTDGLINKTYIDFGNYNYGAVAAAARYTLDEAQAFAGTFNLLGRGSKSGMYFGNPRNQRMIAAGWRDYVHGRIGR